MTIKQVVIWGSIYLWINVVDAAVLSNLHLQKSIPLIMVIFWTLFSGIILGGLQQKWKRDKEFAKIVADRLLRRADTDIQYGFNMQQMYTLNNLGLAQSANAMGSMPSGLGTGNSQGILSSVFGGNPAIVNGVASKYPGTQG